MSRVRLVLIALGTAFALPALTGAAAPSSTTSHKAIIGAWRSTLESIPLSSSFDESVWGKNARSTRLVEMTVTPAGDATLTVTRKILDAKGREIKAATSIEQAKISIGDVDRSNDVRSDLAVTVTHAERRYPDDPKGAWPLEGLRVTVSTFADDPSRIEVRVDTPEGRGSFWETLRRGARSSSVR
jgi:hypothetical protein